MKAVALLLLLFAVADAQPRQPGWEIRVADRVEVVTGAAGQIAIAIAVDRGLTVSKDANVIVDLAPPPGVTIRKKRLGRSDAVDPGADAPRFAAAVKSDSVGAHTVGVRVRFWVCGGRSCRPVDVRRSAVVAVSDAPVVEPPPSN